MYNSKSKWLKEGEAKSTVNAQGILQNTFSIYFKMFIN